MHLAPVREFRSRLSSYVSGDEPVVVTRHGKVSGLFLPLEDASRLPDDLRRELSAVLGSHLSQLLDQQGVTEEEILDDFRELRRSRR